RCAGDRQVHGRMGLLYRYWRDGQVVDTVMFAMVSKPWRAPQAQDNVHDLLKALRTRVVRHLEVVILIDYLAAAHAEVQPSVTQPVQHGGLFGHEDRMVEVEDTDPGADTDFAGAGGDVGGEGQR